MIKETTVTENVNLKPIELTEAERKPSLNSLLEIIRNSGRNISPEPDSMDFLLSKINKRAVETFQAIKEYCLVKQYTEMEKLLLNSLIDERLFADFFFDIADSAIQLEVLKRLSATPDFYPYLDCIQKQRPFIGLELLKDKIKKERFFGPEMDLEKAQNELDQLQQNSFFKTYLIKRGVLDEKGGLCSSKQNLFNSLKLLPKLLGLEIGSVEVNIKSYNQAILSSAYKKFSDLFDEALKTTPEPYPQWMKDLVSIRNSKSNSLEARIEKSSKVLIQVKGYPNIQKLKDFLSLSDNKTNILVSQFESGPLQELNLGLKWDFSRTFLDHLKVKEDLELLYAETLLEFAEKNKHQFTGLFELEKIAEKIPLQEIQSTMRRKIQSLYEDVFSKESSEVSDYETYVLFSQGFKKLYEDVKGKVSDFSQIQLVEEFYSDYNVQALQMLKEQIDPTPKVEEVVQPVEILEETPQQPVFSFDNLEMFKKWEKGTSCDFCLKSYMKNFYGKISSERNEQEVLLDLHFIRDLIIRFLRNEARMIGFPIPVEISSLDQLDGLILELSYRKFQSWLPFIEKSHPRHPFLVALQEISEREIPLSHKRLLTFKSLYESPISSEGIRPQHLAFLKTCLQNPFTKTFDLRLVEPLITHSSFLEGKGKNWIRRNSLSDLTLFYDQAIKEMEELKMPFYIYSYILRDSIEKGDLETLDRIKNEILYARFLKIITELPKYGLFFNFSSLFALKVQMAALPIAEKIAKLKVFVQEMEDKEISNYLQFRLERPYCDVTKMSVQESETLHQKIEKYVKEGTEKPFYRFLQEHHFSWVVWDQETALYCSHLYDKFVRSQSTIAKSKAYESKGGECFIEELKHLNRFDFSSLDQLAELLHRGESLDLQKCCNLGFERGMSLKFRSLILQDKESIKREIISVFEKIPDRSKKMNFLKCLETEKLNEWFFFLMKDGSEASKQIGYSYLKSKIGKGTSVSDSELFYFSMKSYFGYTSDFLDSDVDFQVAAKSRLEKLEKWIEEEGSSSAIKLILEKDGYLDDQGKIPNKVSYIDTLKNIENSVRIVSKTLLIKNEKSLIQNYNFKGLGFEQLNRFDAALSIEWYEAFLLQLPEGSILKKECLSLYNAQESSWEKVLESTRSLLKNNEEGICPTLLNDTFYDLISVTRSNLEQMFPQLEEDSGIAFYFDATGIKILDRVPFQRQHDYIVRSVKKLSDYVAKKITQLQIEGDFEGFLYRDVIGKLQDGLENSKDHEEASRRLDQLTYLEYQKALSKLPGARTSSANKIRKKQVEKEGGSPLQMIQKAKEDLPKLGLTQEGQNRLMAILNRDEYVEGWDISSRSWARLIDSPLSKLPCFQRIKNETTLYGKYVAKEQFTLSLLVHLHAEVKKLNMDLFYQELIGQAYYTSNFSMLYWICQEVSYEKYKIALQELQKKGEDVSLLYSSLWESEGLETSVKIEKAIEVLKSNPSSEHQHLLDVLTCADVKLVG